MKHAMKMLALVVLCAAFAYPQKPMDSANEKAVQITQGPSITGISGTSATINWTTNHEGANHVRYRRAGSNDPWKSAYHSGGGTQHSLQMTGLQPGQSYEYQILTRDGDLRTSGQFQTAGTATGTAPNVNGGNSTPVSTPAAGTPTAGNNGPSGDKVTIYRGVGPNGMHFYTANQGEIAAAGLQSEGVAGYLLKEQRPGTEPLYRMLGPNGDHFYTANAAEHTSVQAQGYHDEGIVGYMAQTNWRGTTPFYRMMNPQTGHFYTTNAQERQQAMQNGYKDEGVVGYIWTQQ